MISWHRVGQKVTCKVGVGWAHSVTGREPKNQPVLNEVYTIGGVHAEGEEVGFDLVEILEESGYWLSEGFEPVYPQALDRLRGLLTPTLEEKRPFLEEIIADRVAGLPV